MTSEARNGSKQPPASGEGTGKRWRETNGPPLGMGGGETHVRRKKEERAWAFTGVPTDPRQAPLVPH